MRRDFLERHAARLLDEHPYTGARLDDVLGFLELAEIRRFEPGITWL